MSIEIQQEQIGTVRLLALSGRLDTETAVDVELALQDLLAAGEREFLIDRSGIGYVSSAGLRVLLGQKAGSSYTSDLTADGIRNMVKSAMEIAAIGSADPAVAD